MRGGGGGCEGERGKVLTSFRGSKSSTSSTVDVVV